jgi:Lrp/AsnC family transcriptional regulator for asnA, asnC and gidA
VLQRNGRESFRSVAKRLGVAEATVRVRYQRLVAANALQVTAITNPAALGFEAISMVGVRASGSPREVANAIISWPEATYVVITSGQFDLLVELVCRDRVHLVDLIGRLRSVAGVAQTETFFYFELSKQLYDWGATDEAGGQRTNGSRR